MRRDIFQAIADPTRRAIITLIALHAMTPNAIAENFMVRQFDEKGRIKYRLTAPYMMHFPDDDSSELKSPTLIHYRPNAPQLTLTGNNANNILSGVEGNDLLDGGFGADTLQGGMGDDIYIVDNTNDVVVETRLQAAGSIIRVSTSVDGVEANASSANVSVSRDGGKVVGIDTTKGAIDCDKLGMVVAGHSSVLADMAGFRLPIESLALQALVCPSSKQDQEGQF